MMAVSWNNDKELALIEYFREERMLWDPTHKHYKDKFRNSDAWWKISTRMDIPVADLKRKKDSLLGSYRSYKKKIKESANSDEVYKPVWFAYDTLDSFLGEKRKTVNTKEPEENSSKLPENNTVTNRRKRIQKIEKRQQTVSLDMDECELFGLFVAKKLKSYSYRTRTYMQHHISNALFCADQGEYDNISRSASPMNDSEKHFQIIAINGTPTNNSKTPVDSNVFTKKISS